MEFIQELLNGDFMPHGHCLLWRTDLLILHVGGDLLTFIAYMLIPFGLVRLVKARDDLRFNWMFLMFAGFIFFCGATHLLGVINIWHGYYYIHGMVKTLTGFISIATALLLWYLMPQIISLPSKRNMLQKITELTQAEKQLAESNQRLETEVKKRTAQLEKMATTDELTSLINRRETMRILDIEISRTIRQQTPLTIMMLDLDDFKAINDNFGHLSGDQTLKTVAECCNAQLRKTDFIGRIGGEEFLVILPDTAIVSASELAERIRHALEQQTSAQSSLPLFTVSIGVAQCRRTDTPASLIQLADEALYRAKATGRNRVCLAES
ncbi:MULTISPECIES: GGDEF domain-containing protein [unclassified Arsukibacterium]|uniref:GGDEF domain-containing protein n=1 Tax=unclassified Arsukibacterium TaxID=2635278 RepID=UPI000C41427D|nr:MULTISPECIES: GGDEF domain-containing protein [unclassified Arsukibacterium]MAA93151.1 GGDEF domain-containing protein [Rheinheimera sp.]MBM33723.1 GGDEF domain-containing protein [Rheinheimera sp.]HAW91443.1 GGDEF domain-containing protein [Candidatus Azambacteria bacterium]